ncbi:MAG: transposase, partial [Rhodothermaceae bacterium]|nr:transposase [Rhodothermaceae bacterium]
MARDATSSVFCYADTTLRKDTQNDAILRFVDDWKARTGDLPGDLVFDSRFTTYANLAELTRHGINFITLRRRHAALLQQIYTLEPEAWTPTRLSNIGRAYRNPSVAEQTVKLRNYPQDVRQLFVKHLGHDKPTVLITNQMERTASQLIDRYARRMIIENVISDAIDFFHMDALSSAVPMRINADVQLTVMASILYRLMGVRVGEGYETAEARRIYRDLGRQSGKITIGQDDILVQIRSRAKAGYLIAAGYPELRQKIPWLGHNGSSPLFGLLEARFSHR